MKSCLPVSASGFSPPWSWATLNVTLWCLVETSTLMLLLFMVDVDGLSRSLIWLLFLTVFLKYNLMNCLPVVNELSILMIRCHTGSCRVALFTPRDAYKPFASPPGSVTWIRLLVGSCLIILRLFYSVNFQFWVVVAVSNCDYILWALSYIVRAIACIIDVQYYWFRAPQEAVVLFMHTRDTKRVGPPVPTGSYRSQG